MNRRQFAKRSGAALLVAIAGGTVWRAWDNGVFSTGTGPAYDPWTNWRESRQSGTLGLVQAAILAANPHNTQPWLFRLGEGWIEVYADTSRNLGSFDPFLREMHIGLGCAVENIKQAGRGLGFDPAEGLEPGSLLPIPLTNALQPIAWADLPKAVPSPNTFFHAIGNRRTHRGAYDRAKLIDDALLTDMARLAGRFPSLRLDLFQDNNNRDRLAELIVKSTERIIADRAMSQDSARWFRFDWDDLQKHRDGISLDTTGMPPLMLAAAKILPSLPLEINDAQWLAATRDQHTASAPLFGIIAVGDLYDRPTALQAGQLWQQLHLYGTTKGLAMQPLNQPPEMVDRDRQLGRPSQTKDALSALVGDDAWQPTFIFRAGYADSEARLSPRRAVAEVVRS